MNTYPYHRVEYNFLTTFSFSLQNYQIMWKTPSILIRKILKKCKNNTRIAFCLCNSRDFAILTLQSDGISSILYIVLSIPYIIPPIPGAPPMGAGFSSGLSTMRHSVVRNIPAIEAAFSRATRATLAGSITPALRRSSNTSVRAL